MTSTDDAPTADFAARSGMKPLRLALFSGNYNYVMDGPVRALNRLIARVEELGHEALVFAPTTKKPAFEHSGELHSIPSIALPGGRDEYRFATGLTRAAKRRLDAFSPTLIQVSAPDYLGLTALNYARARAIPAVASFHTRFDTYPRYYAMKWAEKYVTNYLRYFYKRCVRVYAPAQSMVEELKRDRIGEDLAIWSRGVDHDLFNPEKRDQAWRTGKGVKEGDVLVAFVGRLVLEKGVDLFAEALTLAQKKEPHLRGIIVGDGPARGHFEQIAPGAIFLGHQQGEALASAYANADMFLNPSITETFGNVTLEAISSGLPVICAAASGSRSIVDDGVNGYLVNIEEGAPAFANALTRLASNQEERTVMSRAARASSARFNWNVIIDDLVADYLAIVNRSKA